MSTRPSQPVLAPPPRIEPSSHSLFVDFDGTLVPLVDRLTRHTSRADFRFVLEQRGMFSYSGLTREQVGRLRSEFAVYAIDSGRICVAALNKRNMDYVADAIATVIN